MPNAIDGLKELIGNNTYLVDDSPASIDSWINSHPLNIQRDFKKKHAYARIVSLYSFDKLYKSIIKSTDHVCVISGDHDELELAYAAFEKLTTTSFSEGIDLSDRWTHRTIKTEANRYDLVLCNQVLEHTPFPDISIENLASLVKPGGYLWVSVPIVNRIHEEPHFYFSGFHPRYIKKLSEANGLRVIHTGVWGSKKYLLSAVSRKWLPSKKLKRGLHSNSDLMFPSGIFIDGRRNDLSHPTDCWFLLEK